MAMFFKVFKGAIIMSLLSFELLFPKTFEKKYIGYAYDLKTNEFIYSESYKEIFKDGIHLSTSNIYKDKNGMIIGYRESNYSKNPFIPEFYLKNNKIEYEEGCIVLEKGFKLYHKDKGKSIKFSQTFLFSDDIVVDSGIHHFILKNFDKLKNNKVLRVRIGVPSQLKLLPFLIKKEMEYQLAGKHLMRVKIAIDSFFISLLVDPVLVDYDVDKKVFFQYIGISNIYDENYKSYFVRMNFQHNEEERK